MIAGRLAGHGQFCFVASALQRVGVVPGACGVDVRSASQCCRGAGRCGCGGGCGDRSGGARLGLHARRLACRRGVHGRSCCGGSHLAAGCSAADRARRACRRDVFGDRVGSGGCGGLAGWRRRAGGVVSTTAERFGRGVAITGGTGVLTAADCACPSRYRRCVGRSRGTHRG